MIEEILEPENLAQAWKRVKANQGAPGIDGMTVEDFPAFARGTGRGLPLRLETEPIILRPCAGCSFRNPTGPSAR